MIGLLLWLLWSNSLPPMRLCIEKSRLQKIYIEKISIVFLKIFFKLLTIMEFENCGDLSRLWVRLITNNRNQNEVNTKFDHMKIAIGTYLYYSWYDVTGSISADDKHWTNWQQEKEQNCRLLTLLSTSLKYRVLLFYILILYVILF